MERIVFADDWKEFFAGFSLVSFSDFFYFSAGKIINKNNKRNVSILNLGPDDGKVFYLKRFTNPHIKDILSAWYSFGKPTSQSELEWKNIHLLKNNAIQTYTAVCFGEQKTIGLERKSFIITEKINALEFIDFLPQRWHKLGKVKQEKIITAIAKLIRKAHDADISLPDFSAWHLFISPDSIEDNPQLSVIDLHRMKGNVTDQNKKIKDLGKFLWSMSPKYFDAGHKNLFICGYIGDNYREDKSSLKNKIHRRAKVLLKRHRPKNY